MSERPPTGFWSTCPCHGELAPETPHPQLWHRMGSLPRPCLGAVEAGAGNEIRALFVSQNGKGVCLGLQISFQQTKTCPGKVRGASAFLSPCYFRGGVAHRCDEPPQLLGWAPVPLSPAPDGWSALEAPRASSQKPAHARDTRPHPLGRHHQKRRMMPGAGRRGGRGGSAPGTPQGVQCGAAGAGRSGGSSLGPAPRGQERVPRNNLSVTFAASPLVRAQAWKQPSDRQWMTDDDAGQRTVEHKAVVTGRSADARHMIPRP